MSLFILFAFLFGIVSLSFAETVESLKTKISSTNDAIQKLEAEIKQYQDQIDSISIEKDSLSNTIKSLDITKKQLLANTKITENKISAKNLEIKELVAKISDKKERIVDGQRVIRQSLYNISQMNSDTLVEILLNSKSLSEMWNSSDQLNTLQYNMLNRIKDLEDLKYDLEKNKKLTEKKKSELVLLQNDLKNQTKIIADTMTEKNNLLAETKNTETNYKKLLATRKAQKEAFEKEVLEYESALKVAIDPNSIPSTATGILHYPLDRTRITQYFGNTDFATKNPQVYNGRGHTGIDFAASIGTPVKAALSGTVLATGNTDLAKYCYSYGKWIMIKHANGLSTLYAHLSLINVSQGQNISTGDILGYSGNTGYSTGPHLHFGVYASEGVTISKNKNSRYCSTVYIPYASFNAYLNPLSYL